MAESTIPYSFTPGTKAKANEVNANFLALANGLDESREYTKTEVTKLESKLDDKVTEMTSSKALKDLSNTNFTTNCIIEAPNGIATYENTTITVKEGLRALISNGRNSDGTLKSIEYTVNEDIQYSPNMQEEEREFFLSSNGVISSYDTKAVCTSIVQPIIAQTEGIWYNPLDNVWKVTNNTGNTWNATNVIRIGAFKTDTSSIVSMETETPTNILKFQDRQLITHWLQPDYTAGIIMTLNVTQQAPYDGVIIIQGGTNGQNIEIGDVCIGQEKDKLTQVTISRIGAGANDRQTLFLPIAKGYWVYIIAHASSLATLYPLKGVTNA